MNAAEAQEIRSLLLRTDEHYRLLAEEHHQLDDLLQSLTQRFYLSTSEQVEEARLKKRKLAVKDRMEEIARNFSLRS